MAQVDLHGLPPVLATLLAPWAQTVELSGPGTGDRVSVTAARSFSALRRRVVLTPRLDRAFAEARAATDALAVALDGEVVSPFLPRDTARAALVELTVWLRRAEPNEVTKDLGLGW